MKLIAFPFGEGFLYGEVSLCNEEGAPKYSSYGYIFDVRDPDNILGPDYLDGYGIHWGFYLQEDGSVLLHDSMSGGSSDIVAEYHIDLGDEPRLVEWENLEALMCA